jgi:hypothetical protein
VQARRRGAHHRAHKDTYSTAQTRTRRPAVQGKLEPMNDETQAGARGAPSGETLPETGEAQRNLGAILSELGHQAADGSVAAAAGYATKKILDKLGNRHPNDKEPRRRTLLRKTLLRHSRSSGALSTAVPPLAGHSRKIAGVPPETRPDRPGQGHDPDLLTLSCQSHRFQPDTSGRAGRGPWPAGSRTPGPRRWPRSLCCFCPRSPISPASSASGSGEAA